jgi:hypothetical protein
MANTIHIDIVSAEGEVYMGAATMVFAPASKRVLITAPPDFRVEQRRHKKGLPRLLAAPSLTLLRIAPEP